MNAPKARQRLASDEQVATLDAVLKKVPVPDRDSEKGLRCSLRLYGQLSPILRRGGQIVDGRRRLAALTQLGTEPWIVDLPTAAEQKADTTLLGRSFFELNACRRELPLAARAAIADALATLQKGSNQHTSGAPSREEAAQTVGISADTLDRYRLVKTNPEVHGKVMRNELSLRQGVREVQVRALGERARKVANLRGDVQVGLEDLSTHAVRYSVLYADPPWDYGREQGGSHPAAPQQHYETMTLDAIKALPVPEIAAKDAVLWLWCPNSYLERALDVVKAWGFRFATTAVWVKRNSVVTPGSVRPSHETLIVAHRGEGILRKGAPMSSVYTDDQARRAHSQKPPHFAEELERLYPDAARMELFCRSPRPGWHALGHGVGRVVAPIGTTAANDDAETTPRPAKVEKPMATQKEPGPKATAKNAGRAKPTVQKAAKKSVRKSPK